MWYLVLLEKCQWLVVKRVRVSVGMRNVRDRDLTIHPAKSTK